ncbi:tetratricopeptide repeat protein [Fulvivirga kasyanovii]|uniref:Tetratricopeptide repeat protein n=1 Tax=Fulvivirga kasyanovii TaxID=396812 RepID=A0ABW9RLK3_9BACT|nr:tetratricopeptide repeat protein [Fulvivirga kasyanovii]MTI24989.1 tetratricopeptide repeat protein [Fulvivirga kasyanovii]
MKKFLILSLLIIISLTANAQSQEVRLANEYYSQGEYEKAKKLYDDLARDLDNIPLIHNNYFFLLLEMTEYNEAEKYIKRLIKKFPNNLYYQLDLGVLLKNSGQESQAQKYFDGLIDEIKYDNYRTRITADYFVNKQLTNMAIRTFKEARDAINNQYAYALEMANIYRIMNEKDLMVQEYLNYVSQNPSNLNYVKNTLQSLLAKPEELQSLEMLLYDKIQNEPNSEIYSELLIWVNLQQKNFYGAFIQARAIDKRLRTEGSRSINIGLMALENNDYNNAIKIFTYIIKEFPGTYNYLLAKMYLIKSYEKRVRNTYPIDEREIRNLINDYNNFINELGITRNTLEALRNKALLHAFYLDEKDSAIAILNKIIDTPRANPDIKAKSKLDLGDIYILTEEPWESTLLYSQVEKSHKEDPLGYEAKLRNAKLSYYKGEFQLAQEHLDILKQATTREIANDAMALSLLIKDNIAFDSTETAMKKYAAIELLLFQNKIAPALRAIEDMREEYAGHSLSDELLWKEAEIQKKLGHFDIAISLLQQIVDKYDDDILSDDAYFTIGSIYDRQLNDAEKAMEIYRTFLTKYPGSVYVAEARKRFRQLRGDYNALDERLPNSEL